MALGVLTFNAIAASMKQERNREFWAFLYLPDFRSFSGTVKKVIAIMCTQGTLKYHEIREECPKDKWFPILTYIVKCRQILPLFLDEKVAKQFIKRNLPKDWLHGAIDLTEEDEKLLRLKFEVREMNYPNLLKDIKNLEWKEEILELSDIPEFNTSYM